ncbi:hypothetical protein [Streptomyces xantholiticus]|uniref:hypothetical protein n=1 Tax=Streptomyces xantholiticus TaxID=68285 RepID=UPI00167324B1|nr:hypothetical protein [Streptomyces xantholiticus]
MESTKNSVSLDLSVVRVSTRTSQSSRQNRMAQVASPLTEVKSSATALYFS